MIVLAMFTTLSFPKNGVRSVTRSVVLITNMESRKNKNFLTTYVKEHKSHNISDVAQGS